MKVGDVLNLIKRECTITVVSEEIGELWNGLLMDVPEMTKQYNLTGIDVTSDDADIIVFVKL